MQFSLRSTIALVLTFIALTASTLAWASALAARSATRRSALGLPAVDSLNGVGITHRSVLFLPNNSRFRFQQLQR
ncbi:hypothetical protein C8R45DRAFT_1004655 [Mycena sanguinolenta]|nr:hypothetical protein C8R45DRAFT_1004655 [Mycena sanguinolenta]